MKRKGPKDQYWSQKRAIDAKENRNCGQCDFNFQSIQEIMFHVKSTEGHKPYCAHCDSKFSNYRNYRCHVRKFHFENTVITCEECGKISKTKERHLLHWNYAHKIEDGSYCDYCGLKGLNKSKTRQHMIYCKKYHPSLAIAEKICSAVTEDMKDRCDNLSYEQFVEWKEKVYDEILQNLLQGKPDSQLDPVELGSRAKSHLDSVYSISDEERIEGVNCLEEDRANSGNGQIEIDFEENEEQANEDLKEIVYESGVNIDKTRLRGSV